MLTNWNLAEQSWLVAVIAVVLSISLGIFWSYFPRLAKVSQSGPNDKTTSTSASGAATSTRTATTATPMSPKEKAEATIALLFSHCFGNNVDAIKQLLASDEYKLLNLDLNTVTDDSGNTLLHIVSFYGYYDILTFLVNNKHMTNINVCDRYGHTSLHWAAIQENLKCMQFLLNFNENNNCKIKINVNGQNTDGLFVVLRQIPVYLVGGRTCLHLAAEFGCPKSIELLLKHSKIDANIKDFNGYTALQLALLNKREDCVKLLRDVTMVNGGNDENDNNINNMNENKIELFEIFCRDAIKTQKRVSKLILKSKLPGQHGNCCATCRKLYKVGDAEKEQNKDKQDKILLVPRDPNSAD